MNQISRMMRVSLAITAGLIEVACYRQVPIDTATPAPSTRIIAKVTDAGVVAMGNLIGPSAESVEGVVVEATDTAWKLQMLRVDQRGGASVDWNREVVSFPRSALSRPTIKSLDRKRSWMAAGAIAVGAVLAAQAFKAIGADAPTDGTPTPATILLLPRFR